MDTASLLVSHHVGAGRRILLLGVLGWVALGLLVVGGLDLDLLSVQMPDDPMLGPIRWIPLARSLA